MQPHTPIKNNWQAEFLCRRKATRSRRSKRGILLTELYFNATKKTGYRAGFCFMTFH